MIGSKPISSEFECTLTQMSYYVIAVLVLKIQLLSLQPCEGVLTGFRR